MQNEEHFDLAAFTVVLLGNGPNVTLPPYQLALRVTKLEDLVSANEALSSIRSGDVIGFDTEYRQFRGPHGLFICIVQIATQDDIFVLDMTQIRDCPSHLRRILVDTTIIKCGVSLDSDARMFWDDFAIESYRLVDLGWMIRIAFPMHYRSNPGGISLQQCVADVLHRYMAKDERKTKWEKGLRGSSSSTQAATDYAALDAQAGRELYPILVKAVEVTSRQRKTVIPEDWYAYNFIGGRSIRMERDLDGMYERWSFQVCRWYKGAVITNFWL
ncbi:ribonuclease H-like domain-containing protein [Favolaschia claudopus]|uniref:3'-5' exonuclease n=1 Tax=Favolaschia claudopus TaxID=2862362 RepID=A0AAW0AYV4_9AGAR